MLFVIEERGEKGRADGRGGTGDGEEEQVGREGEERKKRKGTNVLTIWSGSGKCNKLPGVWHRSWPPVMYSEELAT